MRFTLTHSEIEFSTHKRIFGVNPAMRKTTLEKLGPNLPIPLPPTKDQKFTTDFSFKSWGLSEDKTIGEIKRKAQYMGPFINKVLGLMLHKCGGVDFAASDDSKKEYMLNQMPMMNVLYMWIYLRYDQLDEMIRLDVGCPGCGRMNKNFTASLAGLDVDVVEKDDKEIAEYVLKKTFTLDKKDSEVVKNLKIRRTPWEAMDRADDETTTNQGKITELIFHKSIVGCNDETGYVDFEKVAKKIRKRDIERLSIEIQDHNAGPSLAIEGKCAFCPVTFFRQLDWSYDTFFGNSSLPAN